MAHTSALLALNFSSLILSLCGGSFMPAFFVPVIPPADKILLPPHLCGVALTITEYVEYSERGSECESDRISGIS